MFVKYCICEFCTVVFIQCCSVNFKNTVPVNSCVTPPVCVLCCLSVELKYNLDQYVNKRYPGLVKIVRNSKREGLIRARIHGWNAATAPAVGFFDAHVEFNTAW